MILDVATEETQDRFGRKYAHTIYQLKCDECGSIWWKRAKKSVIEATKTHSCSKECHKIANSKGGSINRLSVQTCLKNTGYEYPMQASDVREKSVMTCQEVYGVDNIRKSQYFKDRAALTSKEKFGCKFPSQSAVIKSKVIATCQERYGCSSTLQLKSVRDRLNEVCREKYDCEWPMQSFEVRQKSVSTCRKKYGCDHPMQVESIRMKVNSIESHRKAHETMKRNGSYAMKSRPENTLFGLLCETFGSENVERQVLMNSKWPIDFYVKSINTYIQFDGSYWHGLDRPLEEIQQSKSPRDKVILEKFQVDRVQEKWFEENSLTLVRFTDQELKGML